MVPPAYGGERNQIVLFKTLTWSRRYSWFLQRLKYNGKHTHTHTSDYIYNVPEVLIIPSVPQTHWKTQ